MLPKDRRDKLPAGHEFSQAAASPLTLEPENMTNENPITIKLWAAFADNDIAALKTENRVSGEISGNSDGQIRLF